jgi:phenylalanyl-tRNA synthetase beta chain
MALLGFPVEGMLSLGDPLADIVVARVVEAGRHPNADRLSLCRVDAGQGELIDVVCGAPNVRAGGLYPYVPVGGVLPGGMKIRKAKIRGETSYGMLCSAKELGLGVDHSGILELRTDAPLGSSFVEAYALAGDMRLDVEVTANRGDMLSQLGIAREVAPEGAGSITLPPVPGAPVVDFAWVTDAERVEVDGVGVSIRESDLCGRFLGAIVRGVRVGPSPDWLQSRLRSVGARPINNVVDATNYVLFELGQPTHAYDLSTLRGAEVMARCASTDERIRTLDDVERRLSDDMLVIADAEAAINIAGIMGDAETGVSETTTDLFVECAHFEPRQVRRTKKALGIQSDAGYRYERFVDPEGQERALRRVLEIILATTGGTLHPVVADVHPRPWSPPRVSLRMARVKRLLGIEFSYADIQGLLRPLGFGIGADEDGVIEIVVPGWRGYDVTREIDVIEEIARRYGFDRFPQEGGRDRGNTVPDDPLFQLEDALRDLLVGRGLFEAQTPAFVPSAEGEVRLSNPLSQEEPVLRRALVPSLLRRLERNLAHGVRDVRLFELGTSFTLPTPGEAPAEETRVAVVLTGRREPEHWAGSDQALDLWDVKGLLGSIADRVWPGARLEAGAGVEGGPWAPGRGFTAFCGDRLVGVGGEVDPGALDLPRWAGAVLALEVSLPATPAAPLDPIARPLPAFPAIERDVALLVPHDVPAADLKDQALDAGGRLLESVDIFDLYEGDALPDGVRSIAYRFRFRSAERTLTDEEVERVFRSILARLEEEAGVQIRR